MKTLYTCGDSFMSCDYPATNTVSFLDRFADTKKFRHVSLAKSGSTNFCIRAQIDEAIRMQADYVIVGGTTSDRIDIPKPTPHKVENVSAVRGFFNNLRRWHEVLWPGNKMFNRHIGLRTFEYRGYGCRSEQTVRNKSADGDWATTISDSINNMVTELADNNIHNNLDRGITPELKKVIEDYVLWMHDESYAQQRDYWIMQSGLYALERAGIPYSFIPGPLRIFDWSQHSIVWPADAAQPWDRPEGFNEDSVTHVFNAGHEILYQTLVDIATDW